MRQTGTAGTQGALAACCLILVKAVGLAAVLDMLVAGRVCVRHKAVMAQLFILAVILLTLKAICGSCTLLLVFFTVF